MSIQNKYKITFPNGMDLSIEQTIIDESTVLKQLFVENLSVEMKTIDPQIFTIILTCIRCYHSNKKNVELIVKILDNLEFDKLMDFVIAVGYLKIDYLVEAASISFKNILNTKSVEEIRNLYKITPDQIGEINDEKRIN